MRAIGCCVARVSLYMTWRVRMKILILGNGRHGKDTVAELITEYFGYTFKSSSMAAAEKAVFPTLSERYGYETVQECYEDRSNHRQEWKQLITEYNTPDKSKLCREIIKDNDGYIGMRCDKEFEASRSLFDVILWVDASDRKPADPTMAIEYDPKGMMRVDNNGSLDDLRDNVKALRLYVVEEAVMWGVWE